MYMLELSLHRIKKKKMLRSKRRGHLRNDIIVEDVHDMGHYICY